MTSIGTKVYSTTRAVGYFIIDGTDGSLVDILGSSDFLEVKANGSYAGSGMVFVILVEVPTRQSPCSQVPSRCTKSMNQKHEPASGIPRTKGGISLRGFGVLA